MEVSLLIRESISTLAAPRLPPRKLVKHPVLLLPAFNKNHGNGRSFTAYGREIGKPAAAAVEMQHMNSPAGGDPRFPPEVSL